MTNERSHLRGLACSAVVLGFFTAGCSKVSHDTRADDGRDGEDPADTDAATDENRAERDAASGDGGRSSDDSGVGASEDASTDGSDLGDAGATDERTFGVYLGSTHAHTEFSFDATDMGGGTPRDAFAAAKQAGADFYITTDHVDQMYGDDAHTPEQFQTALTMADEATDETFVAIAGFEFHLDENEMNTFNLDLTREIHELSWQVSPVGYLDFLSDFPDAVSQWNHPGRKESEFNQFEGHSPARDASVTLLEVLNGEEEVYDQSYQKALDAGWHVSPSAGHDTHDDARFEIDPRTGVLAESLTREHILEAFRKRRTFASQDPKLKVWYHLNGAVMGSIIAAADRYEATVRVEGGEQVPLIEILTRAGEVVSAGSPSAGQWSSELAAKAGDFYYARLTGADGTMTWTAPVWVSDKNP